MTRIDENMRLHANEKKMKGGLLNIESIFTDFSYYIQA